MEQNNLLDPKTIIKNLWDWGHFNNPSYKDSNNITFNDLNNLTLESKEVIQALQSFQEFDYNLEIFVQDFHNRMFIADGDIGPATKKLLQTPRCGYPDYTSEILDNFGDGGSWNRGCVKEYPNDYAAIINFDTSKIPSKIESYFDKSLELAAKVHAEIGFIAIFRKNQPSGAHMLEKFQVLSGSTIGYHYFPQSNSCSQITGRFDPGWQPDDYEMWTTLVLHEALGHGCGLRHTRGGVMNPSLVRVNPLTWKRDPSYSTLVRYFGGKPINPSPNPNPTPVPTPVPTPIPIPPNPDDTLLERLLDAIRSFLGNCAKENGTEEVKRRIKSRGIRERIQLRNIVRQEVLPGRQKEMYDKVLAEWYQADDKEIDMLTDHMPDKFVI